MEGSPNDEKCSCSVKRGPGARDSAPVRVAFRARNGVGPRGLAFAAQWLAYALPYRRFVAALADANARLGADVDRYSFIVVDFLRSNMRTTVLAYVIASVGLLMLIFGAWGMFVLNNAEIDVALTDEAIVFALIGGGLAMIGVAQALRLLLVVVITRR
jgi:hypothetical protein